MKLKTSIKYKFTGCDEAQIVNFGLLPNIIDVES